MKKLIFILSVTFMFSCSSPEDNQSTNSNVKLLKSVTGDIGSSERFCSFYYENNRLLKYNFGEKDAWMDMNQLTYENDKIKKIARDFSNNTTTNADNFSYNYDFNSSPNVEIISYTNNSVFYQGLYRDYTFNLNNQNQVISILEDNALTEEFVYSNNQIIKQKNFDFNTQDEYTFVFDDKINPFNVLYTKFGLLDSYMCPILGRQQIYYFLLPNNATKVFKNGTMLYSYIYQYNSDNYPVSVVASDYSKNETSHYTYVYTN